MPVAGCGERLAEGRTSEVFTYGRGSVVKVPRPGVPPHWPRTEAAIADEIHRAGVPCPEVRGLVEVDGRESVVFERIDGPSVWELMAAQPDRLDHFGRLLADIQAAINDVGRLPAVPLLNHRTVSKILAAEGLTEAERNGAHRLAGALPFGSSLCHGDLHPGNVLMGADGPMIIDWFDASIGRPEADVARTSLLIRSPSVGQAMPPHLPGARPPLLEAFHRRYVAQVVRRWPADRVDQAATALLRWERALAAGRLAEHTTADRADLLALWRDRTCGRSGSVLAQVLGELGVVGERVIDEALEPAVDLWAGHQHQVVEP